MPLAALLGRHGYRVGIDDFSAESEGAGNGGSAQGAPERFGYKPMQWTPLSRDDDGQSARVRFTARMLYGGICFHSFLMVDAGGMVSVVRMDGDDLVSQNSHWAVHETMVARNGMSLLLRRRSKQFMLADTLNTSLREKTGAGRSERVANQQVIGPLDLRGLDSRVAIEFRNVEFLDDVSFDEARLEQFCPLPVRPHAVIARRPAQGRAGTAGMHDLRVSRGADRLRPRPEWPAYREQRAAQ